MSCVYGKCVQQIQHLEDDVFFRVSHNRVPRWRFSEKEDHTMKTGLLIAEADAEVREMFDRIANHLGFDVETAADGLDCWNKLRNSVPDVLVIDAEILWGGSDGVLSCLRDGACRTLMPDVFVIGQDRPEVLSRRFAVPVRNCFQKPFQLGVLLSFVLAGAGPRRQLQFN
jgi:CheY-like chemotaxis protein